MSCPRRGELFPGPSWFRLGTPHGDGADPAPSRPSGVPCPLRIPARRAVRSLDFEVFMAKRVLITGGAGFIGSHVADELLEHGYAVRVLDDLSPQVHGPGGAAPDYLDPDVELMVGDVRDPDALQK